MTLVIDAPNTTAATSILSDGFTANWNSVSGATGYKLDVSTNINFSTTVLSEDFSLCTGNGTVLDASINTKTHTTGWSGAKIYENPGNLRLQANSTAAVGNIISPTLNLSANGGSATLTFDCGWYTANANVVASTVTVWHAANGSTFTQIGTLTTTATMTNRSFSITGGTSSSKIKIEGYGQTNHNFFVDNISVTQNMNLSGYDNLTVSSGTSQVVTGLSPNTTYYYRVRTVGGNSTSTSSTPAISVTTNKIDQTITFGALDTKTYGDATFTVSATGGASGNPVTFTSSDETVATCTGTNGTTVTVLKAGSCNIYANQTGNTGYNAASQVSQSVTVNAKELTAMSSALAANKAWDGTTTAVISGTFTGIVGVDVVSLAGNFDNATMGNGKSVTAINTLIGSKAANYNYTGTLPSDLTANITAISYSSSTNTNLSSSGLTTDQLANTDVLVSSAELTINQDASVHAITVNPGAKLTLNSAKTLNVGTFILQSDAGGTGTFVDNGGTLNATTTNVQQYLTTGRNWYISSPLSGASSAVFNAAAASNINKLYSYDETQGSSATLNWPQITDNSTSLAVGKGYVANVDASLLAATNGVTFSGGSLNTGDITTGVNSVPALSYTSDQAFAGYNLVGNPYCSYLNWNTVSKTNLASTMWYKTKVGGSYYFYTYHVVDGAAGIGISVPADVTNLIPPMQAFWVLASASGSSLTFHNSDRVHKNVSNNILRSRAQINTAVQLARLQVSNGVNTDETVLYTYPTASNQYDSYDSPKMSNGNAAIPEIYTLVSGEKLVINGMNSIPFDTEIPLGFTTGQAGSNFSIKASELNNFVAGTRVILKDYLDTNNPVIADLSDGSSYVFSSGVSTNNTSRFALIFKAPSITTGINPADSGSFWISTNANGQIMLNGTPNAETSVAVYNAIGQRMAAQNLSSTIKVLDTRLVPGVYTIVLKSVGKTATTKVIIK